MKRMNGMRNHLGLALAACAAASEPSAAAAQDVSGGSGETVVIDEILVTAQRRVERAQDVPIAINVVSGADLEKAAVDRTEQALDLIPGLTFENRGISQSNMFLRGVGTSLAELGAESGVAMYVDDVYIGSPLAFNVALFDAERIEVLRGPQGTLYGKNALGGALKFYSARPSENFGGKLEASAGNYDYRQVRGTLNVPLAGGEVRTRFSAVAEEREGIYRNQYVYPGIERLDTLDSVGVRGQVEFNPSDAWTVAVAGDWGHDEPLQAAEGRPQLEEVLRTRVQRSPYAFREERDLWGASASATRTGEHVVFSSISAYRDVVSDYQAVGDLANRSFSTDRDAEFDQFSQELRLSSLGAGRVQWTAGVYYYRDHAFYSVPFGLVTLAEPFGYPLGYEERSDATLDTEAFAIFGEATIALNDKWSTSVGLRYGDERKSLDYLHLTNTSDAAMQAFIDDTYGSGSGLTPADFRFAPLGMSADSLRDRDVTPRLVLSYKPNSSLHFYSSATAGTKSGSFNAGFVASTSQFAFNSEKAWSYELGMKSTWLDGRLDLDLATYYTDWKDQQVRSFVPVGPAFLLLINNAGRSTVQGADVTLAATPVAGLRISLGYSYVDATFDKYVDAPAGDLTGNRLPLVPRHSGSAMVDYTYPLTALMTLNVHADVTRRSSAYSDEVNDPRFEIQPRGFTNASIGLDVGRWQLRLWARNVFDQEYILRSAQGILGRSGAYSLPRMYGARVSVNFD